MKSTIDALSKIFGFTLLPRFFVLLFIALTIGVGVDYFINRDGDWRLRFFVFGLTIIMTFIVYHIANQLKTRQRVRKAVNRLSLEDCEYVLKCHDEDMYFAFKLGGEDAEFQIKWKNVLYVPTGKVIAVRTPYKICVYEYAYDVAKRRLRKEKGHANP